jgi:hypothetical protein
MRRFDRSRYVKGAYIIGGTFAPDGRALDAFEFPSRRDVGPERTKPTATSAPALDYIKARTAALHEISAKLDPVARQIEELAAKVRQR